MRCIAWLAVAGPIAAVAADFADEIRPLLEAHCLACHQDANPLGGLSVQSREAALRGGAAGPSIVAGDPEGSPLLTRLALPEGSPGAMPPAGPRPSASEVSAVREWIQAGAPWPSALRTAAGGPPPADDDEMALVRTIHRRIQRRAREEGDAPFDAYDEPIPDTDAALRMVPITGGLFVQGTPPGEEGRQPDEGPTRRVQVDAFWMSAHEMSWDAFRSFMLREANVYTDPDETAAAVSSPTPPYMEMSFGMGISGYPAISMTQHAASKYAQWLSAKTGRYYRLPTEAEWEHACRAGTESARPFGDDASALGDHAWYWENSDAQYQPVGTKKPNPWGLHDMLGNVWEWTLDGYAPSYADGTEVAVNPWRRAETLYPRAVRGGSWMDDAPSLRCGARKASDESWKMQDPQLPKSIWYHTDAQWLGFRLVRPAQLPTPEQMHARWNSAGSDR